MAALLAGGLIVAPAAYGSSGSSLVAAGLLGLPSLHSIIQAIASGFFGALAGALVPSWLKHGTVATIQQLVALPDPATWTHVSQLQGEMTYLGAMLLPVTLAVGATRYWLIGLTGATHPASAVVRCAAVTGALVVYRWFVAQTVAATNTLTHGILGLPVVANGLQRIVGVLFGGALLSGAGGVFGAFLVIIGVVFAAGLFAAQVLVTVALAVLIVAGPPLIAISAIPELSHLARGWADALLAVALVPLGWTLLFATAGALCLDATSFTGASGGLPGRVAAAFAGLITFVLAVKLPLMMLGEVRNIFARQSLRGASSSQQASRMPGGERVKAAHARLRAVGLDGVPSLGRSVGRAAGALGAPAGGPIGAARRGLGAARRRTGVVAGGGAAARATTAGVARRRHGVRERLADARTILRSAPREAMTAVSAGSRRASRAHHRPATGSGGRTAAPGKGGSRSSGQTAAATPSAAGSRSPGTRGRAGSVTAVVAPARAPGAGASSSPSAPARSGVAARVETPPRSAQAGDERDHPGGAASPPSPPRPPEMHPVGKRDGRLRPGRTPAAQTPPVTPVAGGRREPPAARQAPKGRAQNPATPDDTGQPRNPPAKDKPRPRSGP
jgi:hypothetical protein